jgi:hypothetical protein
VKNIARLIRKHFPDQKRRIDLLLAKDHEFFSLCEDYTVCVDALRYWEKSQQPEAYIRADEYRTLVRELKVEIAQSLSALERRQLD